MASLPVASQLAANLFGQASQFPVAYLIGLSMGRCIWYRKVLPLFLYVPDALQGSVQLGLPICPPEKARTKLKMGLRYWRRMVDSLRCFHPSPKRLGSRLQCSDGEAQQIKCRCWMRSVFTHFIVRADHSIDAVACWYSPVAKETGINARITVMAVHF